IFMIFFYAPEEKTMGIVQKIFYFHVSSAWISFLAFFITFIFSILYLIKNSIYCDNIASSSAEIGIVFCSIVLVTGPLWAKPVWGAYWTWDPRLSTTLILWFIYISYLLLRKFVDDEQKKHTFSSILGIIGFIDVPFVYFAIKWFRTIHPDVFSKGGGLEQSMLYTLFVSLAAFTFLYINLIIKRVIAGNIELEINKLKYQED
ncbi:MAG: cytochrome c biogenesis protein, partial [Deferribacterota bacterium]|nr:cytochrome c biogenesis protein [Deferribacterota bacterium]